MDSVLLPHSTQEGTIAVLALPLAELGAHDHHVHGVSEAVQIIGLEFHPVFYASSCCVSCTVPRTTSVHAVHVLQHESLAAFAYALFDEVCEVGVDIRLKGVDV